MDNAKEQMGTGPLLVIAGLPASGKSRVGRMLARVLNLPFLDVDQEIENRANLTCAQMFAAWGESGFRQREHELIAELLEVHRGILSLGGGAVENPDTRQLLRSQQVAVLEAGTEVALARIAKKAGKRPLIVENPREKYLELVRRRRDIYAQVATFTVQSSSAPAQHTVAKILAKIAGLKTESFSSQIELFTPAQNAHIATTIEQMYPEIDSVKVGEFLSHLQSKTLRVGSGAESYPVYLGNLNLASLIARVLKAEKLDSYFPQLLLGYPEVIEPEAKEIGAEIKDRGFKVTIFAHAPGEEAKTFAQAQRIWQVCGENNFGRDDAVIALGGGATTDALGFIASTWLRGIKCINIPTTLLGMVDAAIGGKTALNTDQGKNLVGTFTPPAAVLCHLPFLDTLPPADLQAGFGEVIKCGFIADRKILQLVANLPKEAAITAAQPWNEAQTYQQAQKTTSEASEQLLKTLKAANALTELIWRAVQVKAQVVSADLKEGGLREILNYGHTFGHALEKASGYKLRHGHAVAVGMMFASHLAQLEGLLSSEQVEMHRLILEKLGLPVDLKHGYLQAQIDPADGDNCGGKLPNWQALRDFMNNDKKARAKKLRFILVTSLDSENTLPKLLATPAQLNVLAACELYRLTAPAEEKLQAAFEALAK